jgi:hypothetical protein
MYNKLEECLSLWAYGLRLIYSLWQLEFSTWIMNSNPSWGMDICSHIFSVFVLSCVEKNLWWIHLTFRKSFQMPRRFIISEPILNWNRLEGLIHYS